MPSVASRTPASFSASRPKVTAPTRISVRLSALLSSVQLPGTRGNSEPSATGENPLKTRVPTCLRCVMAMRPVPRRLVDTLLSRDCFRCPECGRRRKLFRLDWTIGLRVLPVALCVAGLVSFAPRPAFLTRRASTQGEADALAQARAATGGQLSPFEQMMAHKPRIILNNDQILQLWKAQVSAPLIIHLVRTSDGDYDLSTRAVIALKSAGVEESIIMAMVDANYAAR